VQRPLFGGGAPAKVFHAVGFQKRKFSGSAKSHGQTPAAGARLALLSTEAVWRPLP
jgi:hypothetical protein